MNKYFLLICLVVAFVETALSQSIDNPSIKLIQPYKINNEVFSSKQFVSGSVCKTCSLTINDSSVKVYATGAFAYELNLKGGDTSIVFVATNNGNSITKKINYNYIIPKPAESVKTVDIATIETYPEGNLLLMLGDKISFKIKALTGCTVTAFNKIPLYELPSNQTKNIQGIYEGEYVIKESDNFNASTIPFTLVTKDGETISKKSKYTITVLSDTMSNVAVTKGRLAHLEYGLGDDRLGGAKIGYLDSNVVLHIVGKVGTHYKVQLSKSHTAYVPDDLVTLLPKGTITPSYLTNKWTVYGDSVYDYVKIGLTERLPYQSFQLINPSKIVVDVYGATNNTNWITQMLSAQEIKNVYYEQMEDDVFRITIELKHQQHWGHQIYYQGNNLMIKIKQQPKELALNKLTIAIDAGHGGTNTGAVGPTGVYEKDLTLAISLKLQQLLEKEDAKVIMTRTKEQFFDNKERILFYRDSLPDLLLSIHLNSSEDPINISGTSTYYRYVGFRNLSLSIYKRMLELGLKEYGNTGSFNFMLNSPTEYPNALVETLFLSNPEEEMKILDQGFQQQMAQKIVLGIKDFVQQCKTNN